MSSMTTLPARVIPTRRVEFTFQPGLHRHFMNGDLVQSHVVAILSSMFPEGEDFFVRSVRNYRSRIRDPELKRQVSGFIGQEAIHGREHREFNDRLAEFGYPTHLVDRCVHHGLALLGKVQPRRDQLAVTAALEHYTATLAEVFLTCDMTDLSDVEEVRSIFQWHALEESEHKSVAFDVFQQVCGKHHVRAGVMRATTVVFLVALALGTAISLALDPASRDLRRLRRSLANFRRSPFLSEHVRDRLRDYYRRDFHPDDHDTTELLHRWRAELFGTSGSLNAKVKGARAAAAA